MYKMENRKNNKDNKVQGHKKTKHILSKKIQTNEHVDRL